MNEATQAKLPLTQGRKGGWKENRIDNKRLMGEETRGIERKRSI